MKYIKAVGMLSDNKQLQIGVIKKLCDRPGKLFCFSKNIEGSRWRRGGLMVSALDSGYTYAYKNS